MAVVDIYTTRRRYATILADPPWSYEGNRSKTEKEERDMWGRGIPYRTLEYEELAVLPVARLAAHSAVLWLWTTNAHLHEALHLCEAWGFSYRTKRVWVKPRIGTGYWLRGQTEDLLVAVCGAPTRGRKRHGSAIDGNNISTLLKEDAAFEAPTSKHSSKPPESYRAIERLSKEPRIELFARRPRRGWDSWGLEAKDIDKAFGRDMRRYL